MAEAVNVMDIVDARSLEITAAMEAISTNSCISVNLHIPFHVRRRAASHNPKRLPGKYRFDQAADDVPGKKRAWKRKRVRKEVAGKAVRLESHIWHAKRCHMSDIWGYRLANSTTQRGIRAAYRAVKGAATLQDTSFYHWFSLESSELRDKLVAHFKPVPKYTHQLTATLLHHKNVCLGPVLVYWLSSSLIFARLHPAVSNNIILSDVFNGLTVVSYKDKLSQFTIDGVRSFELLVNSLNLAHGNSDYISNIWSALKDNPFSYDMMAGAALGCELEVPPGQYIPPHHIFDGEISQPEHRITPDTKYQGDLLFNALRSGDMHSNKDLNTLSNTLKSLDMEPMEYISTNKVPKTLLCCIFKDPQSNSLTVLLPSGTGTRFWIPLVYNGGRVIGFYDKRSMLTEQGYPSFPEDYPDTPAGQEHMSNVGNELSAKEQRRPPQKRVDYKSLGISSPFISDWKSLCGSDDVRVMRDRTVLHQLMETNTTLSEYHQYLVAVSVCSVKRGTVSPLSHLYYTTQTTDTDLTYSPSDTYPLVGFVTSGAYSLSHGKGAGVGFVLLSVFKSPGTLLCRKPTSKLYRTVKIQLIC